MRRHLLAVLLVLFAVPATAHASAGFVAEGVVEVPNPGSFAGGLTELYAPCDDASDLQGFDGWWVKLPASAAGRDASLIVGGDADLDAYFYTARCQHIADADMNAGLIGDDESGVVPDGAAWVIVNLYLGYDAPFRFIVA